MNNDLSLNITNEISC